jgi:cysteine synthase A
MNKFKALEGLIGNTPLLEIKLKYKGQDRVVYAKAEYFNLSGSIKDRIALHILREAYQKGEIKPGDSVAEATSGNTGIAISAVASYLGHETVIYMPDWMSDERKNLIRAFGATIRLVSKEEGGFKGSIQMADDSAANGGVFLPHQFSNPNNTAAHMLTTAPEIERQLEAAEKKLEGFVAGVGTGGTVMGVGKYFKAKNPSAKIFPLEPANSPTMSTGYKVGAHRIQGISDEFIPALVDLKFLDDIVAVDDGDSIVMAQQLSRKLGLGVGISSGANLLGALKAQDIMGNPHAVVVTTFSDDSKKYLSTDYSKEITVTENFMSKDIELIDYSSIR